MSAQSLAGSSSGMAHRRPLRLQRRPLALLRMAPASNRSSTAAGWRGRRAALLIGVLGAFAGAILWAATSHHGASDKAMPASGDRATTALPAPPTPTVHGLTCTIVGTDGDDVLRGTQGDDVLCGLGGDDVIAGGSGDDTLAGGPGRDMVTYRRAAAGIRLRLASDASGEGHDVLSGFEKQSARATTTRSSERPGPTGSPVVAVAT